MVVSKTEQVTKALSGFKSTFGGSSALFNGVLIILTISGEQLFNRFTFKCPCSFPTNMSLGGSFLFAPAIALFLFGIFLNSTTWRIVHGCFYRSVHTRHGLKRSIFYWGHVISQALVAPLAWLFVAFLDGSYYECFRAGDFCVAATNDTSALEGQVGSPKFAALISGQGKVDPNCVCNLPSLVSTQLRATSQLVAWLLLVVSVSVVLIVVMLSRCLDRMTYIQMKYIKSYRAIEKQEFEKIAVAQATSLAQKNSEAFFEKSKRTKLDWDKISVVPLSEIPHILDDELLDAKEEPYYSPLHQWILDRNDLANRWQEAVRASSVEHLAKSDSNGANMEQSKPLIEPKSPAVTIDDEQSQ